MEVEELIEAAREVRHSESWQHFWTKLKELKVEALLQLADVDLAANVSEAYKLQAFVAWIDVLLLYPDEMQTRVSEVMQEAQNA